MSNLDNIIQRILDDANVKAEALLKEASDKKDSIVKKSSDEANMFSNELLNKAKAEAEQIKEKAKSNASLKSRDMILKAKQSVIDKVLENAKDKLTNLDEETFIGYLKSKLSSEKFEKGSELLVPASMVESVKKALPDYAISKDNVESGFAINNGSFLLNNDFAGMVDYQKEDLEIEVVKKLFEE